MTALLGVQGYSSFGQGSYNDYLATPSAHAMSLAKFAITPVSLHNGTANVGVPICNLTGVDVSINYQTSGIRVQDVAGPVGLGWTLNAGGAVTRVMRGRPDEDNADGWCGNGKAGNVIKTFIEHQGNGTVKHIVSGAIDTQPDLFYFNVGKFSGSFVLTPEGVPVLTPYQDVKIEPAIGDQSQHNFWVITAPDGTKYYFGETGNSQEISEYSTSVVNGRTESFTSSWYVSRIVNPAGTEVTFEYDIGNDYTYKNYRESATDEYRPNNTVAAASHVVIENIITIKSAKRVKKIQSAEGSIEFTFINARSDIDGGKHVQSISQKNAQGSTLKTFVMFYSYFKGYFDANHLKLDALQEIGYPPYRFTYNSLELPPRDVFQIDHWGYFNNNTYQRLYYSATPGFTTPTGVWVTGANREADPSRAKACMLEKIQYPTGGYTAYEYELNSFLNNGTEVRGGGLRIKKMTIYDGLDLSKNREINYEYKNGTTTSGVLNGVFPYNYLSITTRNIVQNSSTNVKYTRSSEPVNYWKNGSEPFVGYGTVTTYESGNGKTVNQFYTALDLGHADVQPLKYYYYYKEDGDKFVDDNKSAYGRDNTIVTYTPTNNYHWRRGLPKATSIYNQAGKLLKNTSYVFEYAGNKSTPMNALTSHTVYRPGNTIIKEYIIRYGVYAITSEVYRLRSTTETNYSDNNPVTSTTQTTEFTYGNNHLQPIETKVTHPGGFQTITRTQYAADYRFNVAPSTGDTPNWAIYAMQNKHMLTSIIEQTTWRKFSSSGALYIQAGKITEFKEQNGLVLPSKDYVFESNQPIVEIAYAASNEGFGYQKDVRYYKNFLREVNYNSEGKVNATTPYKGQSNSVIWGEYSTDKQQTTRPIAKVTNAAPELIAYTSFEQRSLGNWSILGVNLLKTCDQQYYDCLNSSNYPPGEQASICESRRQSCLVNEGIIVAGGYTGEKALYKPSGSITLEKTSLVAGSYVVSLWAKGSGSISLNGAYAQAVSANWSQHRWVVSPVVNGKIQVNIPAGIYVDELRLHPQEAHMTSYTFKNGVGLSSSNNPNGIITFYEYDAQNRLKLVKDHEHNIVKMHQYAYHTDDDFTYTQISDFTTRFNTGIPGDISTLGYSYHWSFGDGSTLVTTNPEVTHSYVNINLHYNVTLQIKDANDRVISTKSHRIYSQGANGNLRITHSTANPSACIHRFTASSGNLASNGSFEYHWEIEGISYTDTTAAQLHTFSQCTITEVYPIKLSIVNKNTGVIVARVTSNVTIEANTNSGGGGGSGGSGGSGGIMLEPLGPNPPTYEQTNEQ